MKIKNVIIITAFMLCGFILSGCTSIGSHIISTPSRYLTMLGGFDVDTKRMGYTNQTYCSKVTKKCIPYLSAAPFKAADFPNGLEYTLNFSRKTGKNTVFHRTTPDRFDHFKGTAVLIHGYGGKKELMSVSAMYFRALGFNVIIPDLFGHGESEEDFVFAAQEHLLLEELLTELKNNSHEDSPIIAVGHSIGTLPATNLLLSEQVDAAILLAPLIRFDLAAKQYLSSRAPAIMKSLFTDNMDDIIEQSMNDASVTLVETDLLKKFNKTKKPILLINSDIDLVSPPDYFSGIKKDNIKKMVFTERKHVSLITFSEKDALRLEGWLKSSLIFNRGNMLVKQY